MLSLMTADDMQMAADPRKSAKKSAKIRVPLRFVITIDGPAGVGKSTVAKRLATRLGLVYLDTGATYRALAYAALKANLNLVADAGKVSALARGLSLQLRPAPDGGVRVFLNRADITRAIRTEEVSEAAALVSQEPDVRAAMVSLQRKIAFAHFTTSPPLGRLPRAFSLEPRASTGVVVEGRDTGSVVFPRATFKFFLDADPAIRARRRQQELARLYGTKPPLGQVREQLHFRDSLDRSRRVGPLVKPAGAVVIDTSHLTAPHVVRVMLRHIRKISP